MSIKKQNIFSKNNIIEQIQKSHPNFDSANIEKSIDVFFDQITAALINGDRVELRGFASWIVRKRKKKMVRNPQTNEKIILEPRGSVYFRASKKLTKDLNNKKSD